MLITLPAYLAYHHSVGDDEIGKLKAIILVPWSFKLIWAPIMDSFTIRSMGRRRVWIIGAEVMMAVTLLGFIGLSNPAEHLRFLLYMYFLHNCFASLQDVCTDALAVDILPPHEQGQMNGMMWGSKLVGKGLGAWGLAHVLAWGGIEACVVVQIALLLAVVVVPLMLVERAGEKRFPWSAGKASVHDEANVRSPWEVFKSLLVAFSLPTTIIYIFFTLAKLIGVGVNEVVTNTLYTQQLDPKWTDVEFSTASGLYSLLPIMIGAICGGFLADRFGRHLILLAGFGGYGIGAMVFAACSELWNERWFTVSYVLYYETMFAVGAVGFLSMAMRISWTKSAAIVFTVYLTLSNVSHVAGNWLAGPLRAWFKFGDESRAADMLSYELTFWFVGLITLLPTLLLIWVRPSAVDRRRDLPEAV